MAFHLQGTTISCLLTLVMLSNSDHLHKDPVHHYQPTITNFSANHNTCPVGIKPHYPSLDYQARERRNYLHLEFPIETPQEDEPDGASPAKDSFIEKECRGSCTQNWINQTRNGCYTNPNRFCKKSGTIPLPDDTNNMACAFLGIEITGEGPFKASLDFHEANRFGTKPQTWTLDLKGNVSVSVGCWPWTQIREKPDVRAKFSKPGVCMPLKFKRLENRQTDCYVTSNDNGTNWNVKKDQHCEFNCTEARKPYFKYMKSYKGKEHDLTNAFTPFCYLAGINIAEDAKTGDKCGVKSSIFQRWEVYKNSKSLKCPVTCGCPKSDCGK
eukprot:m.29826 g.29826  ORF g.29826 m.29826 type:complete len:326 (+) comp31235_c0_seq3:82-1059(+)